MGIAIKGYQPTSMIEWPGKIVSIIFTGGCNLRCPFCHNSELVLNNSKLPDLDFDVVFEKIKSRKMWIDAIEFTGGEPLINPEIKTMLNKTKEAGFLTKLDTNGCFPDKLKEIINEKLVDYIAMDIKAPLEKYEKVTNTKVDLKAVQESIRLIMNSGVDYEFRTTVLPKLHSKEDVEEIGKLIKGAKKYWLQNFVPKNTLDESYMKEKPFPATTLNEFKKMLEKYVDKVGIR